MKDKMSPNTSNYNIKIDTLLKYLELLINYDTWDALMSLKNISTRTLVKILNYGREVGFIRSEYDTLGEKPKKKYVLIEGEYDIVLNNKRYKLIISREGVPVSKKRQIVLGIQRVVNMQ